MFFKIKHKEKFFYNSLAIPVNLNFTALKYSKIISNDTKFNTNIIDKKQ